MKVVFNDGTEKKLSDEWQAAKLIHLSVKHGNKLGYAIRLDESLSENEKKRQANILQQYIDYLRIKDR